MKDLISLFFKRTTNTELKNNQFNRIQKETGVKKIFDAISNFSEKSEIRYVGGCIRKILNKEDFDDIDLATNLNPKEVSEVLIKNNINFYNTGIEHGTITANIGKKNFEITSLRKDISTDGRRAVVEFTDDWNLDANRRDFTINTIYSDIEGNLFDPLNGKKDLDDGCVRFVGKPEERIKEDYLRILRYIRFFLNYSKNDHDYYIKKIIRQNISGIKNLSNERLLDELEKIVKSKNFLKIFDDKFCYEIILLIFPQIKNISNLNKLNKFSKEKFNSKDFIFILSIMIIDESDNSDFFLYKYNLSNESKKRINFLKKTYPNMKQKISYSENYLWKIYYHYGKEFLIDYVDFKIFRSKNIDTNLINLKNSIISKDKPIFPIKAKKLIDDYNLKEGKELGNKLKKLEKIWIENSFKISNSEIDHVVKN